MDQSFPWDQNRDGAFLGQTKATKVFSYPLSLRLHFRIGQLNTQSPPLAS